VRQVSRNASGSCLVGDDFYLVGDALANWPTDISVVGVGNY